MMSTYPDNPVLLAHQALLVNPEPQVKKVIREKTARMDLWVFQVPLEKQGQKVEKDLKVSEVTLDLQALQDRKGNEEIQGQWELLVRKVKKETEVPMESEGRED